MTDLSWVRPRLAELCGLSEDSGYELFDPKTFERFPNWSPDLNVSQAIRCMEAMKSEISLGFRPNHQPQNDYKPWCCWNDAWRVWDITPARAVCLAIASTLGWKTP